MRDIGKPAFILFLICLIVSTCLAFTYSITKDKIRERAEKDAENARKSVLTDVDSFKKIEDLESIVSGSPDLEAVREAYAGYGGDALGGYVFTVAASGYGGEFLVTVGIDSEGRVEGVRIGENKETPGLGTKASEKPFLSQLEDVLPGERLEVIKNKKSKPEEIEAVSGATITSTAVVKAVQAAVDTVAGLSERDGEVK